MCHHVPPDRCRRAALLREQALVLLRALTLAGALVASTGGTTPPDRAFDRYPAAMKRLDHKRPLKLRDRKSVRYRSALRGAASRPVDFAGHYVLATIGCGASCLRIAAIDRADGHVAWFPSTLCCWPVDVTMPIAYRRDSRLLIVQGQFDEQGPNIVRRFVFDGKSFTLL